MSKTPAKEMIERMQASLGHEGVYVGNKTVERALTAALQSAADTPPPSSHLRVKPLEWQNYEARSPAGHYRVQRLDEKWEPLHDGYYMLPKQGGVVSAFDTINEAKAYAQADYERRILSALAASATEDGR